jgi:hypothetical protein
MKPFRMSFYIATFGLLLFGCSLSQKGSRDPFYQGDGGFDYGRFPLIKPYDAKSVEEIWSINLLADASVTDIHYSSIRDIRKIAVENQVIMIYAPSMSTLDELKLTWFVIVPDQNIEKGFSSESDFLKYLQRFNIMDPTWFEPTSVFQLFEETRCLEWIPDCK